MKKKRSVRLSIVLDLEDRKKRDADRFLAEQVKRVENDKIQLLQLEGYLSEYQAKYQVDCKQGITVLQLTTYQSFMTKIGSVIEQHKVTMKTHIEQLVQVRKFWTQVHARHNAVGSLITKVKNRELAAEDKALQKMIDEASQLKGVKPI